MLLRRLILILLVCFSVLICFGCATQPTRIVELAGWGRIVFVDDINSMKPGERIHGQYTGNGRGNTVLVSRQSHNMEKVIIHELLHAQGFMHRTPEERQRFLEEMRKYGYDSIEDGIQ